MEKDPKASRAAHPAVRHADAVPEPRLSQRRRRRRQRGGRAKYGRKSRSGETVGETGTPHGVASGTIRQDGDRALESGPWPPSPAGGMDAPIASIRQEGECGKGGTKEKEEEEEEERKFCWSVPTDDSLQWCDLRFAPVVQLDRNAARAWPHAVVVHGVPPAVTASKLAAWLLARGDATTQGIASVYVHPRDRWALLRTSTDERARALLGRMTSAPLGPADHGPALHVPDGPRAAAAPHAALDSHHPASSFERALRTWPNAVRVRLVPVARGDVLPPGAADALHASLGRLAREHGDASRYAASRGRAVVSLPSLGAAWDFARHLHSSTFRVADGQCAPCSEPAAGLVRVLCSLTRDGGGGGGGGGGGDPSGSAVAAPLPPGTVVVDAATADGVLADLVASCGNVLGIDMQHVPFRGCAGAVVPVALIQLSAGDGGTVLLRLPERVAAVVQLHNRRLASERRRHWRQRRRRRPRWSASDPSGAQSGPNEKETKNGAGADDRDSDGSDDENREDGKEKVMKGTAAIPPPSPPPLWTDSHDAKEDGEQKAPVLPPLLASVLADPTIYKVGMRVGRIARTMARMFGIECAGMSGLSQFEAMRGLESADVDTVAQLLLGQRVGDPEMATSDWHAPVLAYTQVQYAATNVCLARQIHLALERTMTHEATTATGSTIADP